MKDEISILYVEDEADIREVMVDILELEFSTIFVAKDGKEGIELFHKENPDIVISDIQMPNMNGIQMCEELLKTWEKPKIIFTTAFNEKEFIHKAEQMNITRYINKPIDVGELLEHLEELRNEIKSGS